MSIMSHTATAFFGGMVIHLSILTAQAHASAVEPRLLVFSKIAPDGYRHEAIPLAITAISKLGRQNGFAVDTTEDSKAFTSSNLARYQAVFFNHTFGEVFDSAQRIAFQAYIRKGGGFAGIHASSYAELAWPWYRSLVGAYFKSHSAIIQGTLIVEDQTHLSTVGLPATGKWTHIDEWYDFDANPRPYVHVLLTVDEETYPGGKMGADHPISWYHDFEGGRAWYSAMGHTAECYADSNFLAHLRGGILYAMGTSEPVRILSLPLRVSGSAGQGRRGILTFIEGGTGCLGDIRKEPSYSADGALVP